MGFQLSLRSNIELSTSRSHNLVGSTAAGALHEGFASRESCAQSLEHEEILPWRVMDSALVKVHTHIMTRNDGILKTKRFVKGNKRVYFPHPVLEIVTRTVSGTEFRLYRWGCPSGCRSPRLLPPAGPPVMCCLPFVVSPKAQNCAHRPQFALCLEIRPWPQRTSMCPPRELPPWLAVATLTVTPLRPQPHPLPASRHCGPLPSDPARGRGHRSARNAREQPRCREPRLDPRQCRTASPALPLLTEFQQRGSLRLALNRGRERNIKQSVPAWDSR
ncbi:uncharacterized protein LOC125698582 [Lagopus muta]|uniref:uncharacterized protein LOC125698582 n=1 Tax=Lagopus muta TaxID=64668 RepID=UPI00209ED571|nr:uncharacterized protein LOC125698582 [Lagopus muta]